MSTRNVLKCFDCGRLTILAPFFDFKKLKDGDAFFLYPDDDSDRRQPFCKKCAEKRRAS